VSSVPDAQRRSAFSRAGACVLVPVVLLAACASPSASTTPAGAQQVIASLGAVPVPTGVPAESTPSASPGRPAILAMGGPVAMRFADGAQALVTALGPSQTRSGRAARTPAVIALRIRMTRGAEVVTAGELSSRDETGKAVALRADGPARIRVAGGATGTIRVRGVYDNGSAQMTWRHGGHVLAVWTFTIELD
jgi:hypothetical protein